MFILKPHSGVPIYRQLSEQIRHLVASAQLRPGDELPSIREMALRHAINPMTVSKVYSILESEGILERHRGKPMKVAAQKGAKKGKASLAVRLKQVDSQLDSLVQTGQQLGLDVEDVIKSLKEKWKTNHE